MKYIKPNIDHEWMEALRYREFEKIGKDGWKNIASNNYNITNYNKIKDVLKNVDLRNFLTKARDTTCIQYLCL